MSVLARICALLCLPLLMTAAARADDVDLSALHFDKPTCLVEQKDNPCKALVCELTACTGEKWTDRSGDTQTQMGRMMAASQACRAEHPQLVADLKRCQTEARSARDEQARRQRNKTVEGDREMMSWYEADAAIPRLAANHAREIFDWARHELAVQAESALQPGGRYAGKGPAPDRARLDALRAVESGFRDGKMWFKDWHEESRDYGDACQVWWAFERKHHPCCPYPPGFNDANAVLGLAWQDTFGTTSRALTMMYKDDPQTRQAAARVLGASGWAKVAALESLQDEQLGAMLDRTEQVCLGKTPAARVEVRIAVSLPGHRSQQDIRQFSDALGEVTLGGRIQDASGNPLPGANITVSSGAAPSGQTVARSGADGRWEARVQIGSNGSTRQDGIDFTLTSTGVRLVARQDAAGEGEIVIPCGDADGVLQVRAGQVVDSFGKPVAGAEIGVADQAAGVWSDAQGRFTFKAGIGSASGICNAPADTRISLAFPLQIEAATTHAALPGVTGSDTIPAAWVFAQAEDLPLDLNFSVDGQGIHPGKLRIEAISPVAGKFRIDSLGGRWADAAPGQFHWDGILPAHATLSTAARDWTLLISAEYVDPVSKRTLKGELRRPFRVIEDPRLSAAELKANFDWIAAWWKSHTEDGIVRKEGDSLLDGLQHDAGNLLRTGLSGFGSWGYPSWGLGPYNNFALNYGTRSGSARHEQLLNYTCGAYTARTLNTLNRLRYSDDPAVRRRFLGIEYTPITHWPASVDGNDWYNHVAVLLYAQGYAHLKHATALNLEPGGDAPGSIRPRGGLATVLEPWWDQTAELMPIDAWMDKFVSGGAAGGRIGIMEALTDWASAARVPGVAHSQYAGAEIDKAGSSIDTRPVAGAARSRYLSSLSPVHLLVSDAQGRRFGFDAQGQAVREIPGAEFEIWPAGDGHRIEHLYLPEGDYTLSVQGAADGHFGLVLSDADNGLAYFPDDTPIRAGETVHLALPGDAPPAAITLADGALVQPKLAGGIPATRSGAIAAP
ncbi:MAG: carboxypeptidase regulatory-like domain-containing protein, partial [Gammaproteobacteria bacterium]|nr:carboxypeptidase regulatory-like domain-containing protein [Gammaproteobacteria bacterium]